MTDPTDGDGDVALRDRVRVLSEQLSLAIQGAASARAEADEANRLRDQVLSTVSHALRAPLAVVMLWVNALRSDPGVRARALDAIHESAVAQSRMIDDLLDISRLLNGKLHIDSRLVILERELGAALERIGPAAAAKSVTVEPRIETGLAAVAGDIRRLHQVLDILLANAVKFTAHGGQITVSIRRVESMIEIVVKDDGCGIAAELTPWLFEPFRQAGPALTNAGGGLGLGLPIARKLVELHGGTLTAHSGGVGQGAAFTLLLPVARR